ncbi:MAG: hypothetical protein E3J96_00230 [Sulfurovum sp.]|nr:MAG: hypothetical protein E3J96_00230 [Sulfurovum sp.]
MIYSKADQTRKNRKVNLKKLSNIELRLFKEFIFDISNGKCQCGCNKPLSTYHHGNRGINKDDRTLGGINDICHHDLHFSTDTHKREALTILFKSIGLENWRKHNE